MGKIYSIRKAEGGGVSSRPLKKNKQVLVSFPHSTTPLAQMHHWSMNKLKDECVKALHLRTSDVTAWLRHLADQKWL